MNHEAVVKFALRGCGEEGSRPVMAPLADPTATSGMDAFQGTDASLRYFYPPPQSISTTFHRHIAHALLIGIETKQNQTSLHKVAVSDEGRSDLVAGEGVIPSLVYGVFVCCVFDWFVFRYFRDRVGVPRDLRLPSARQLRGHLNWLIEILLQRI